MERSTHGRSADTSAPEPARSGAQLSPGDVLGEGRYTVRQFLGLGVFAEQYEAIDGQSGAAVAVHLPRAEIVAAPQAVAAVVARARALAASPSANTVTVIGAGDGDPLAYVATEATDATPLAELFVRKQQTGGGGFAPRSTLNVGTRLFAALASVHAQTVHGAITAGSVLVGEGGVVKLADASFAPALGQARTSGIWPADAPLAPELAQGGQPTAASDVYAAGVLLYRVAVGAPPSPGCARPSQATPGLPPEFDEIVARCMLPDPAARFSSAETVHHALAALLEAASAQPEPAPQPSAGQSLAQSIAGADAPTHVDDALAAALADTHERWLVTKDKLDYGPFSTAELVEQINTDQVLPGHLITDNTSGGRCSVEDHPLFADVADRARQARDDRRRANAEESHTVRERRRGVALYGLIGVGVLALGGAAYAIVGKLAEDSGDGGGAGVASIDEEAQLQVTMSTPEVEEPRRRRGGRSGGGGGALGYDDSQSFDLGEGGGGGGERLSNAQLNQTIQGYGGQLGGCLGRTGSSRADIEFIVQGNGKVSGVRVNGETSGPLASCISRVMRSMQFPTFDGHRTRGTFNISL